MAERPLIDDEMREHMRLMRADPARLLELCNERVQREPNSGAAYFARHQAWRRLGNHALAMADLDKSLELEHHYATYGARGNLLREMGRYREAIADFNKSQESDPEAWVNGFNQVFRADCYAHLGDEAAVIADCADIPDDYWTPGPFSTPPGGKAEVTEALRCLARQPKRKRREG